MNAEFLEQKIVIDLVNNEPVITPAKVRKGLDAKAFVGAMVEYHYQNTVSNCMITYAQDKGDGHIVTTVNFGYGYRMFALDYDSETGDITNGVIPGN